MKKVMVPAMMAGLLAGCCCLMGPKFADLQWADDAFADGVWTKDASGVMTASKDKAIWSAADYENFILDFDYKLDPEANSGVIIYTSDVANWIPHSIEVQLLDDYGEHWKNDPSRLKNGSLYGHIGPAKSSVKPAGEWNHMTVYAVGQHIKVVVNGVVNVDEDISKYTDAKKNPDGTPVQPWLSTPMATMPTKGRIGFQGMHGGAKPYFRNVRIAPAK